MKKYLLLIFALISIVSCKESTQTNTTNSQKEQLVLGEGPLKVYLDQKGTLFLNGKESDIKALDDLFAEVKKSNGSVYYSRDRVYEGYRITQVMDLIAKHELSVAFYTDRTFTERIGF